MKTANKENAILREILEAPDPEVKTYQLAKEYGLIPLLLDLIDQAQTSTKNTQI